MRKSNTHEDEKAIEIVDGIDMGEIVKQVSEDDSQGIIKDVWMSNFFQCMQQMADLIDEYNYVSMDTEFPGSVYVPPNTDNEFEYQMIKGNCDNLKLIQVGISLSNEAGEHPKGNTLAWQFNLKFDEKTEQSIAASMLLLRESGLKFDQHKTDGIPQNLFAEYLITSGIVLNKRNHWITFHGGMDFGYLLKYLTGNALPMTQDQYFNDLRMYFVNFYDCKEVMRELNVGGGLAKVASNLDIERIGTNHQGGSDAHLTSEVWFQLRKKLKQMWCIDSEQKIELRFQGKIFGIGDSINDDPYIWDYKEKSKETQFIDSTGYVNVRMMEARYDNSSSSTTETNVFKPTHPSPGSSHAMINTNVMPMQPSISNNGHHSSMGIPEVHQNKNNNMWVNNTNNNSQPMINNHNGMISSNSSVHNINSMPPGGHNNNLEMADSYNQLGGMMQQNALPMNIGMDQMNSINNMNQLNNQQHQQNMAPVNSQMYLLQNPNLINAAAYMGNNNNFHGNMDQNEMINHQQQQYRMMQMNQGNNNHGGNHFQQQQQQQNSYNMNNQQMHQQQPQQQYQGNQNFQFNADFHQQLMQASGQTQNFNQPHPTNSPNMQAQMMNRNKKF